MKSIVKDTVIILRSNPVNPDPRVEKHAYFLAQHEFIVKVFAWNREKTHKITAHLKRVIDAEFEIISIGSKAEYGGGFKSLFSFLKFQIAMFFWLVKHRREFHFIHACDLDTALVGLIVSRLFKKRMIFDIFDFRYSRPSGAFYFIQSMIKKIQLWIINKSDGVIICSEDRRLQIQGSKPKKITIIHNTPYLDFENPQLSQNQSNQIKLVYVGILQDYRLIEEVLKLVSMNDSYSIDIAGFGKLEELVADFASKYSNITYYGKIDYKDTILLESRSDIMMAIYDPKIDNHFFAAPNKFYEAMMLGKPLIMVESTGMSSIIKENDFGVLIRFNQKSLEEGLINLNQRRNEWYDIGKRMRGYYDKHYNSDIMRMRLIAFYDSIK